jgi:phospholipid transport system substrate-binding protein
MRRRFLLLTAPAALLVRPAFAGVDGTAAASFVQKVLTDVLAIVNGPGSTAQKRAKLQPMLDANIDVAGIAQFCVGRFWRTATPVQQGEYVTLFHRILANNVLGRIGDFQGVTFEMGKPVPKEDSVAVGTTLNRPNNAPNRVDWVVADVSGPKVIDVIAEGTSLRLTQRSDYLGFIGRNGNALGPLIDALRQQAAAAAG